MANRDTKRLLEELFENSVCAEECTGLLQRVFTDAEELRRYHYEFNKDKND